MAEACVRKRIRGRPKAGGGPPVFIGFRTGLLSRNRLLYAHFTVNRQTTTGKLRHSCMNWAQPAVWMVLAATVAAAQEGTPQQEAFDLNELGLAATRHQDRTEAERLYRQAVRLWKKMGPDYEAHLASSQTNLGQTLCGVGKRRECAEVLTDSLAHFRNSLGVRNERTLTAMNLLAGVRLMLGDTDGSTALFEEALPIEREFFPNDLQLARSLTGLAGVKLQIGKTAEGLPLAEQGLALTLKTAGEDSLDGGLAYATVAEVHRNLGHGDRALPLFRKSRAIYEKLLGPNHIRVASVLSQEGLILMQEGKLSLAEKSMTRALELLDAGCPACASEHIVMGTNLGLLRMKQEKYEEADRLLSDALQRLEKYSPQPSQDLAFTLTALSIVRRKEKLFEDAERLNQRAGAIMSSFR
jgi:tetratricopeptide (TPR) repeat protein